MKGTALLLCALTLAQAAERRLTLSGKVCHCNPNEAASICSKNGSENELIAHENCNQFYQCVHGSPVAFFCPGFTLYDPIAERCEWPQSVECGDRPIVEPPQPEGSGEGEPDNSSGATGGGGNCDPAEAPAICAAAGSDGILVAHENCNQYYMCAHGAPVTMNCNTNLLYNPYQEQCDWPHNVECGDRPIVEIVIGGHATEEPDCNEPTTTCNCNPAEAPEICAAVGSDGVLVAHENCNQFYICNHGVPVAMTCFGTLRYNPYRELCDWPENVDCGDRYCDQTNPDCDCDSKENVNGGTENGSNESNNNSSATDNENSRPDNGSSGPDNGGSGTDNGGGTCNCNPGEAPGICAAPGSDGVLIAHENCNQFYKCANGVPVALNCPGVLLYNPYTEQCDWPFNVECGDRPIVEIDNGGGDNGGSGSDNGGSGTDNGGGTCNCNPGEAPGICAAPGSDGVLIAHENCNQFYKCANGVPVALNCPGGLLYNAYTEQCDWPYNVECGDRPIVEIDNGGGDNGGSGPDNGGSGTDNGGSGTDNGGGTCNCNPGEAPGICAAPGSDGVLIAHENCNQFYKCANGVPVAVNCPGVLLYNPYTEQCDWPYNVECGDRPIVEIDNGGGDNGGSGPDNGGSGTENGGGTCNCNPGEAPGICAAPGSDGVLIAHENCNQFYKCANGVPVALNCPGGLLYNAYTEQCDWPYNVECGDRPIVEIDNGGGDNGGSGPDNGGSGTDNGGSGTDNGGGTCNCNPGEAPGICAAPGSDGVLIAHENCNQFYKCANGVPVAVNCPGVLLYNPYTEQCDWPYNVECGDRPIVEIDNGGGDNGGSGPDNGGSGTENGGGTCNCNPGEAPGICAAPGSDGVLIAHENCNQFYKCANGVPEALNCPGELLYNPYTEQCDWPFNVECGDRPTVEIDNGGGDNGGSGPENGGSGTDNGGGTCNCNPGEAPGICAAPGSDGVLIAHENCNQFYKCANGVPEALNCPGELLYNPYTEQCDWPYNVECGDRPIVEIDNGGGDNGGSGPDNGGSGTDNGGGTCNCNPGEAPGICAAPGSDGVLIAHENCNQFYKCANGVPVAVNCPGVLLYNPYTEQCDWPYNVECGDRPIVEIDNGGGDNGGSGPDNGGSGTENGGGTCNCNPGEAPGICAAPGSDGVLIAHENCNQFYKCANGVPEALNCPGELLYNPYTEQCDWPFNVECGDRPTVEIDNGGGDNGGSGPDNGGSGTENGGGTCNCNPGEAPGICAAPGSDGVLIAHENCNQFYKCANGVPEALNCPGELLYNPYTEQCDWPFNVECGDRPTVEIDNGGGDNGGSGPENGGSGTDNGGGTCNCNPGEAPGICAAPGSDGVLIAHENCNQFYKCANGVPEALNCPGELLYNPYTEQCDWPYNVECGDRPIVEIDNGGGDNGGSGPDNGGSGTDNGGGTCNCNPGEAPGICAAPGSDGVLIAHENCNQFYKCANGVPVAVNCPGVLLYNPYTEQCDWPYNVECGDRPIVEIDNGGGDNGGSGPDNGGSGTENGGGTCNCNPGEAPGICAAPGSDGVLIAHENCNQFYKCANGVPEALNCPGELLYNPYTEQCDWPFNVECGDRPTVEIDNGGGDNGGSGPDNGGSGTENGGGTCNCNPGEAPGICAAPGSDGVLIAHENCNQFYKCANGVPVALNCHGEMLYNPYTEQCDWPYNVECGDRPIIEVNSSFEDSIDSFEENTNKNDNEGNNCEENSNNNNNCNCNPDNAPSICNAVGSDGSFVAHENCNQFYQCAHGIPVAKFCPGELLYNPFTQLCDWPYNVKCGDRPIVEKEDENEGDDDGDTGNGESDCNCNYEEAPLICSETGSDGTLISHEYCNAFYQCARGTPVTFYCSGELLYNPYTQRCDWPHSVECGERPTKPTETEPNVPDNGNESNEIEGNCDPNQAPIICGAPGSDGVFVAHEICDHYYICAHGQPVASACPSNLLYNPKTEECDWPHKVDCGERIQPDNGESDGPCACDSRQAPAICAGKGSDGKLIAHEDCSQYYVCVAGVPMARSCPASLYYEPRSQACLWAAAVDCEGRTIASMSIYSATNKHAPARRGIV